MLSSTSVEQAKTWLCTYKPDIHVVCRSCRKATRIYMPKDIEWLKNQQIGEHTVDILAGDIVINIILGLRSVVKHSTNLDELKNPWIVVSTDNLSEAVSASRIICTNCEQSIFDFGKYNGLTVREVAKTDRPYCSRIFLTSTDINAPIIQELANILRYPMAVRDDIQFIISKLKTEREGPIGMIELRNSLKDSVSRMIDEACVDGIVRCRLNCRSLYNISKSSLESYVENITKLDDTCKFLLIDAYLEKQ